MSKMRLKDMNLTQEEKEDLSFAVSVAKTGGVEPSEETQVLLIRYKRGEIDLETVHKELAKKYSKQNEN